MRVTRVNFYVNLPYADEPFSSYDEEMNLHDARTLDALKKLSDALADAGLAFEIRPIDAMTEDEPETRVNQRTTTVDEMLTTFNERTFADLVESYQGAK